MVIAIAFTLSQKNRNIVENANNFESCPSLKLRTVLTCSVPAECHGSSLWSFSDPDSYQGDGVTNEIYQHVGRVREDSQRV